MVVTTSFAFIDLDSIRKISRWQFAIHRCIGGIREQWRFWNMLATINWNCSEKFYRGLWTFQCSPTRFRSDYVTYNIAIARVGNLKAMWRRHIKKPELDIVSLAGTAIVGVEKCFVSSPCRLLENAFSKHRKVFYDQ